MATGNIKISQLPSLSTMTGTAEIPVVSGGTTYQITGANLQNYFGGNTGNIGFVGDAIYDLNGVIVENADLSHGATAALILPANGNSTSPVQLNNTYGNIQLTTGTNAGSYKNWLFDRSGNLTLPSNTSSINYANGSPYGGGAGGNTFSSITMTSTPSGAANNIQYGLGNLVSYLDGGWTIGEYNGEFYGTEGIRINPGIEGSADINLPADSLANVNPTSVSNYQGNVVINTGNSHQWKFDDSGTLAAPGNLSIGSIGPIPGSIIYQANATLLTFAQESNGAVGVGWAENLFGPSNVAYADFNTEQSGNINLYTGNNSNPNIWKFTKDGTTLFPVLTTKRGDTTSGTISGYTLNIGDGTQEAIITTPNGDPVGGQNSQRLVINPGAGADLTSGEGGDIYLWAGRGGSGDPANAVSGGSGGDIKIRGGQGGGTDGAGGYIRMEAGDSASSDGAAGYVEITGGYGAGGAGGYVRILGGSGSFGGGDANLTAGGGGAIGGAVNITGGISSNSLAEYGNVYIRSGASTWTFDNTGNLIINHGSRITEVASPVAGQYALSLSGTGATDPDQQLLIYPTSFDANHLHLTSGNLYNTELFLGNDNLYLKLANTGNVVINADDGSGNSFQYIFGADTTITMPGSGLSIDSGYNSGNAGFVAGSGVSVGLTELYTSGNIAAQVVLNRPQVDHTIQLSLYPDDANAATTWTFDDTGNLTAPGNIVANTFVSNAYNVVTAGNLSITSQYGLGVAGTILENGGTLELIGTGTGLGTTGCVIVGWNSSYGNLGNIAQIYFNPVGSTGNIVVTTGNTAATSYEWTFDKNGNLTTPGSGGDITLTNGNITGANVIGAVTVSATGNIGTAGSISASGNFDLDGNANIGGNLFVSGNINFTGNVTQISGNSGVFFGDSQGVGAIFAGTVGYTPLPTAVAQFTGDAPDYIQINAQNINHANTASMEYVITGDLGTDTTDYLDIGFSSSSWDGTQTNSLGTAVQARDGYIYVQGGGGGGNLVIGTTTANRTIKFNVGGPNSANTVGEIFASGLSMVGNVRGGNVLTGGIISATGNITGGNIIATNIGNVAALNLNGNASTVLYGNGVFAAVAAGSSYSDSNVVTLLGAFGSNTVSTTGNVTSGNVNTGIVSATGNVQAGNVRTVGQVSATGNVYAGLNGASGFILGNVNSKIGILGSNATITMSQNIVVTPDQSASPNAGLQVAGGGYILAPNGARVLALGNDGSATVTTNLSLPNGGNVVLSTGNMSVGGNITRSGSITAASWGSAGVGLKLSPSTYTDNTTAAGNLAAQYIHSMGAPTFAFSNAVTVTNAATLYVNTPTAGTNATFTNPWSIYTNGNIGTTVNISATGNVTGGNVNTGIISASGNVTVSGSGGVSIPNLPAFRVYGNTSTVYTANTTITNQAVDYNQGSYYNNTTGIFTAPVAGIYQTQATLRVANNNGLNQASIQKNSSLSGANIVAFWETDTNTGTAVHFPMTGAVKLAVGDTLRLQVITGNVQFDSNDSWSVTFIG